MGFKECSPVGKCGVTVILWKITLYLLVKSVLLSLKEENMTKILFYDII